MRFNLFKRFNGEDIKVYLDRHINVLIDQLNNGLNKLTLDENVDCQVIENIIIGAGAEVSIDHKLGTTPRFHLILKQSGNALITNGQSDWTNKKIYLLNNGANSATLTVCILR